MERSMACGLLAQWGEPRAKSHRNCRPDPSDGRHERSYVRVGESPTICTSVSDSPWTNRSRSRLAFLRRSSQSHRILEFSTKLAVETGPLQSLLVVSR